MKYLMIRKDDKNYPLAITKGSKNGLTFQTDNGAVSARLVPTTSLAATPLRMKVNNEIKSVAAMQSLLIPRLFYSRTGGDLQAPTPRSDYKYYGNIIYDTMNGIFYARETNNFDYNTGEWGHIIQSYDGITWTTCEYGCLFGDFIPIYHGMLCFALEYSDEIDRAGNRDIYIKFYGLSLSGVLMWSDQKIRIVESYHYWNDDWYPIEFHSFCCKKADGPIDRTIGILDYSIISFKESGHEQRSYRTLVIDVNINNLPWIGPELHFSVTDISYDTTEPKSHFYNPILKTFSGGGPGGGKGSYDGITWSNDIPTQKSSPLINGYVYLSDKRALSLDGINPSIYSTEVVTGYDPVDQKYISYGTFYTGKESPRIVFRILSSSDCRNWTEELRIPTDTYWNIGDERCFNYSEELGFTSS